MVGRPPRATRIGTFIQSVTHNQGQTRPDPSGITVTKPATELKVELLLQETILCGPQLYHRPVCTYSLSKIISDDLHSHLRRSDRAQSLRYTTRQLETTGDDVNAHQPLFEAPPPTLVPSIASAGIRKYIPHLGLGPTRRTHIDLDTSTTPDLT